MDKDVLAAFLPSGILDHFKLISLKKVEQSASGKAEYEVYLDERNDLDVSNEFHYKSKGFLPSSRVQDFPIRGKAVYLIIRRRRWVNKQTGKSHQNDYSLVAEGSSLTQELSDFLKGTS